MDISEIKELIKKPIYGLQLNDARIYDYRLKMHCTPIASKSRMHKGHRMFLQGIKDRFGLATDKYKRFEKQFNPPIPTNEFVDNIFTNLKKALHAKNGAFDFVVPEASRDRFETIAHSVKHTIKTEGCKAMQNAINSFIVGDIDEKGNPYVYLCDINQIHDAEINNDGSCNYVVKKTDDGFLYMDSERYIIFNSDCELVNEVPHNLGICPSRPFWSEQFGANNPFMRKSPVSGSLFYLDELCYIEIARNYNFDLTAYPILWVPSFKCDYTDKEGNSCHGGVIVGENDEGMEYKRDCPACSTSKLVGAGDILEVEPDESGNPQTSPPLGMVEASSSSSQNINTHLNQMREYVFNNVVGSYSEATQTAVNEKQVMAGFESKQAVLMAIAENFEKAIRFGIEFAGKVVFKDNYKGCSVNLGDEFFLATTDSLVSKFTDQKSAGVPTSELMHTLKQISQTEHRNNPKSELRAKILKDLEPYCVYSLNEILQLNTLGVIDPLKIKVKVNFSEYIGRLEREKGSITEYGALLDYDKRIEKLNQIITSYAKESETPEFGINEG